MNGLVRAAAVCATLALGLLSAQAADKAFKRDDLADSAIKLEAQIKAEATSATLRTDADAAFKRSDYRTGLQILGQIAAGALRRRVGLLPEGRAPMREGVELYAEGGDRPVGVITSGGFGPSVNAPLAMGYVPIELAAPGTRLHAMLRGKMLPVTVAKLPFIKPGYKRA